jgi:hypothetical protein
VLATNSHIHNNQKLKISLFLIVGFFITFGGYLIFNRITAGNIWPNTFYAKQAEYAQLRQIPLMTRYGKQLLALLPGIGIALLPGFVLSLTQSIRNKDWILLSFILWFLGFLGIYAVRLPVTYQHGRYIIPTLPVFLLIGISGAIPWLTKHFNDQKMIFRVLSKVWMISGISILGIFWFLGAKAFAEDVAIIESEMVTTALWVQKNTEPEALIAAHDIGALGYYSQREIVDLAGLVSPDVIPIIRDEAKLSDYLEKQNVSYLVTFPNWYSSLTKGKNQIYSTRNLFSPDAGGENMAVYKWRP